VYAVGVILYEMFTGAVPFTGDTFMGVLSAHLTQEVPPMRRWVPDMGVSNELEAVVLKALAKDPEQRFQSMSEFGHALQQTPEGRVAAPLAGLVPIPRVTRDSFRPARVSDATTQQHYVLTTPQAVISSLHGAQGSTSSDEPLDAFAPTPLPPRPSRLPLAVVLLGALGITGFLVWHRLPRASWPAPKTSIPMVALMPAQSAAHRESADAAVPVNTANQVQVANGARPITLAVSTEPSGALLFKNSFQVCDSTPCDITADLNEAMELEGRKGTFKGTLRVLAQRDQSVSIVLLPAPPVARKPKSSDSKAKLCEVVVDGLKILRPCTQ